MPDDELLTPEEVRARIEARERQNAEMRAKVPDLAQFFPPITDAQFRQIMERAFLGELRDGHTLPPLDDDL